MKKILIGVLSLLAIFSAISIYVLSSLDGIVKDAIETYGSEATRTRVSVADVNITVETGKAIIHGLDVANPKGFSDSNIFDLAVINVKINTDTVMRNPVIIDKITIRSPLVFYEISQSGVSNVDVLKKNLGLAGGASGSAGKSEGGKPLKVIIRKLVIEGGKVNVRIAALGNGEQNVDIPRIQLTDVGKKSGGATAVEVAQVLGRHLIRNVRNSVAKLGVRQYLGKSAHLFKKGMLDKIGRIGGGLEGGARGAAGNAGGALRGLLGQ